MRPSAALLSLFGLEATATAVARERRPSTSKGGTVMAAVSSGRPSHSRAMLAAWQPPEARLVGSPCSPFSRCLLWLAARRRSHRRRRRRAFRAGPSMEAVRSGSGSHRTRSGLSASGCHRSGACCASTPGSTLRAQGFPRAPRRVGSNSASIIAAAPVLASIETLIQRSLTSGSFLVDARPFRRSGNRAGG
jgi:hypothetical protein